MPLSLGSIHQDTPDTVPDLGRMGLLAALPVPVAIDWGEECPPDGDALGNDHLSNCVPIAELRAIEMRRKVAFNDAWKPTMADVNALYARDAGYVVGDASTDRGTIAVTAMSNWAVHGVRVNSQDLDVVHWLSILPSRIPDIYRALAHTGPVQLSMGLPLGIQERPTDPWRLPVVGDTRAFRWQRGSWGGHRVLLIAYDRDRKTFRVRSWGKDIEVSNDFLLRYALAVDVTLSREWFDASGLSPFKVGWDPVYAEFQSLRAR